MMIEIQHRPNDQGPDMSTTTTDTIYLAAAQGPEKEAMPIILKSATRNTNPENMNDTDLGHVRVRETVIIRNQIIITIMTVDSILAVDHLMKTNTIRGCQDQDL